MRRVCRYARELPIDSECAKPGPANWQARALLLVVYAKLGVHSKQELIDMVDAAKMDLTRYACSYLTKKSCALVKNILSAISSPKRAAILVRKSATFWQPSSHAGTSEPS